MWRCFVNWNKPCIEKASFHYYINLKSCCFSGLGCISFLCSKTIFPHVWSTSTMLHLLDHTSALTMYHFISLKWEAQRKFLPCTLTSHSPYSCLFHIPKNRFQELLRQKGCIGEQSSRAFPPLMSSGQIHMMPAMFPWRSLTNGSSFRNAVTIMYSLFKSLLL